MVDPAQASPSPAPRPIRVWPLAVLVTVYWIFHLVLYQMDVVMFTRFMSTALSALALLVLFLVLWMSNGTVTWRMRFIGLGVFLGGAVAGAALAHSSYQAVGFLMASVPWAVTAVALVMAATRLRNSAIRPAVLAAVLLLSFGFFDVLRWEGLDGRMRSSVTWRWSATPEHAFAAAKGPAASAGTTKPWTIRSGDWPEFRGPRRDGSVRGIHIGTDWKEKPLQKLWSVRVGPGWSSMIVVDNHLVTQEQRGKTEAIVCYEAETGKEIWTHLDETCFTEGIAGPGPRATPTYHEGRIYTLGGNGLLLCLDATNGKPIWSRDFAREGSAPAPQWGCSASPLVADGKIVVFVGGTKALGAVAVDASTGASLWTKLGGPESYSSAHLVTLRGTPQVILQDNKRTAGLGMKNGEILWERANPSLETIPMLQPAPISDGQMLVASGPGLALLELKAEGNSCSITESWSSLKIRPSFSDFVVHDGLAYGLDLGVLTCIDAKSGERKWKKGRFGSGQLLLFEEQGLILVLSEDGKLALVEARAQEPGEIHSFQAIEGKTWNHPSVAQDRLFVRNGAEMACYRLRLLKSP